MLPRGVIEGRLAANPELRFASSGTAVCSLRLVASDRRYNKDTGAWEDTDTLWVDVTCFKQLAEHCAESLAKGDIVLVTGKWKTNEWTTPEGDKRSQIVFTADAVGASLQFRTIRHGEGKAERGTPAADPWASNDEPPF